MKQKEDSGKVGAKVQGGGPLKGRAGPQYETSLKGWVRGFPGGAVVRNPPANAGDTGSSPGSGRSHMPRSN